MLETRIIRITLLEGKSDDDALVAALNKKLAEITGDQGILEAYTLLSDYTNRAKTRFVKFIATFSDLETSESIGTTEGGSFREPRW